MLPTLRRATAYEVPAKQTDKYQSATALGFLRLVTSQVFKYAGMKRSGLTGFAGTSALGVPVSTPSGSIVVTQATYAAAGSVTASLALMATTSVQVTPADAAVTLTSSDGTAVSLEATVDPTTVPGVPGANGPAMYTAPISSTGAYVLHVNGGTGAGMVQVAEPGLSLGARVASSVVAPSSSVLVTATLSGPSGLTILGAEVTAEPIGGTDKVSLRDDGTFPDEVAGDGVYSALVPAGTQPGDSSAMIAASDPLPPYGNRTRIAVVTWYVSDETINVSSPPTIVAAPPVDGISDGVCIPVQLSNSSSLDQTVTVYSQVLDALGVVIAEPSTQTLVPAGQTTTVVVQATGGDIYTGLTEDGPVYVGRTSVQKEDESGVPREVASMIGDIQGVYIARADMRYRSATVSLASGYDSPSATSTVGFEGQVVANGDVVSGVDYSLDAGDTWAPASPTDGAFDSAVESFTISTALIEGETNLLVRPTTVGGAWDTTDCAQAWVVIDCTPPETHDDAMSAYSGTAVVTISASDPAANNQPGSAIDQIMWEVDGGGTQAADFIGQSDAVEAIAVTGAGSHTLTYWAVDKAGNMSTVATRVFTTS
jgi:hypothetical protein